MNNLTSLETILIIYIIVVNILGIIAIIIARYSSNKVGEIMFIILFTLATPIVLPMVLYVLILDKWKRKRKQNLEQQFDDFIKENDK